MNAKQELLEHIADRKVTYVQISYKLYSRNWAIINGKLNEVIPRLDFSYNDGYGTQEIEGTVWYEDGTWSERDEYDGQEWWVHRKRPALPTAANVTTHSNSH